MLLLPLRNQLKVFSPLRASSRIRRIMSTKTLAVLDEADLADGAMKEVAFDGGKVLVARLGDKIHATSAYCTHYGGPLAKGVLTADGRVVCPWHGACFNVCTGDIEDAPALHAIHSFPTSVSDGKILVTADPKYTLKDDNLVREPKIASLSISAEGPNGVVIVGGGAGASHVVESLRENGYTDPITILSLETYAPIDRTKLSKGLPTLVSKVELRSPQELKDKYGVTLRTGVEVVSVDKSSKTVLLSNSESVPYDKLVLATGGTPRKPTNVPGYSPTLVNVHTLRGLSDSQQIEARAKEGKKLVIIGTSFIGMEVSLAVSKKKLAGLDVIGTGNVPFEKILGKEVGQGLMEIFKKSGVNFHMGTTVSEIKVSSEDPTLASGVVLKDGSTLEADEIVFAIGVSPATEFLKKSAGFKLEKDGGILVDEYLKVPGVEDVYAIGDIAIFPQTEEPIPRRIEHWNVAGNHGRAVGRTISGKGLPFAKIPIFWSAQGLRYCGLGGSSNYDDLFIQGDVSAGKFLAYYFKGPKVVAVSSMGSDPVVMKSSELMRIGAMPSAEEIKSGKSPLDVDISSLQALQKITALKA